MRNNIACPTDIMIVMRNTIACPSDIKGSDA